ncbi:MAG: hypothetical protein WAU45_16375 [Blastocatellia bacterium]
MIREADKLAKKLLAGVPEGADALELVAEFPQNPLFAAELAKLNAVSPDPQPHLPMLETDPPVRPSFS